MGGGKLADRVDNLRPVATNSRQAPAPGPTTGPATVSARYPAGRSGGCLTAARRSTRPPEVPPLAPIRSLYYFFPVLEEVLQTPMASDYIIYLRSKVLLKNADSKPNATTSNKDCQFFLQSGSKIKPRGCDQKSVPLLSQPRRPLCVDMCSRPQFKKPHFLMIANSQRMCVVVVLPWSLREANRRPDSKGSRLLNWIGLPSDC